MAAAAQREDHRRLPQQQRFQFLVLNERAGLGVIEADPFAQHSSDLDRKAFVAAMVSEEALGVGQELEHNRVSIFIVANEARHDAGDFRSVARDLIAGSLPLQGEHGVGLHVAHLLDEETGRALAHYLEIAVAPAGVEDGDAARSQLVGAEQGSIHEKVRQIGGGEVHGVFHSRRLAPASGTVAIYGHRGGPGKAVR